MNNILNFINLKKVLIKKLVFTYLIILTILGAIFLRGFYLKSLFLPKPKGYIKIDLPRNEYIQFKYNYPYYFEYSKYAYIESIKNKDKKDKYWLNICYPSFNAKIYLTHKFINNNTKLLQEYYADAHKLISRHYSMADSIKEKEILTKDDFKVIFIEMSGEKIASQCQFFTSDNKHNFLMGSLYFDKTIDQKYSEPIINYIKKDILHLIETLQFKNLK